MEDFSKLNLVGRAPAFVGVLRLIEKYSACDASVLIQGESGTGKELAARAIHYLGARRRNPFIPVNCGAIPDSLVENEFFGHVRGAYTDARESQGGLIANAQGGTLFLDEIEALSPKGQVVLLRFLQDQVYEPLGGRTQSAGSVRIVAASNADITHLAKTGSFRQDLLYQLAILSLRMPTLRERPGDPAILAQHFLGRLAREHKRPEPILERGAIDRLSNHSWPGNVRELENLVQREFLMSDDSNWNFDQSAFQETPLSRLTDLAAGTHIPPDLGCRRA